MATMNGIEYKFYIENLFVKQYDGAPNSVARVGWACVMKRNGAKIIGCGQTDLDAPSTDLFIDIGSLEAQQVIDWVIAKQGGNGWVSAYLNLHDKALTDAESEIGLEAWKVPLVNPLKLDINNV